MNKLIIGLKVGEGANQEFLQSLAKRLNYKYFKILNADKKKQNSNFILAFPNVFDDLQSGLNVVLDIDFINYEEINRLCISAKDSGVLHLQGALPSLTSGLDLLNQEKTVNTILTNENINVHGLDSIYIDDINTEIIKNISSVSEVFAKKNNLNINNNTTTSKPSVITEVFLQNKEILKYALYSLITVLLLGFLFTLITLLN